MLPSCPFSSTRVTPGVHLARILKGFKVASPLGEGFRSRRAFQVHANPCTLYINTLKNCPTSDVISGILNVINVIRHFILGDGKDFPRHQHARHATFLYCDLLICPSLLRNSLITNQPTTNPIAPFICEEIKLN